MGCWNETCAITNLPIKHGDPIAMFMLEYNLYNHGYNEKRTVEPQKNHAGFSYPTDIWRPVCVPIYGEYNDYGSIEEEESNALTDSALQDLRSKADSNEPQNFENFDELIIRYVHRSNFYVRSAHGNHCPIGMMMVHRWAYDLMAKNIEKDWYPAISLEQMVAQGKKFYKYFLNRQMDERDEKYEEIWMSIQPIRFQDTQNENIFGSRNRFVSVFGERSSEVLCNTNLYLDLFVKYGIKERRPVVDPEVQTLIVELAKFFIFAHNISALRKSYAPQSSKGSQDNITEIHEIMLRESLTYVKNAKLAEKEEYGEEEEDE